MKGDISSDFHAPEKRYAGVRAQQGRVLTDADFNAAFDKLLGGAPLATGAGSEFENFERYIFSLTTAANPVQSRERKVDGAVKFPLAPLGNNFWKIDDSGNVLTRDGKPVSFSKEFARGMVKEKGQQFSEEQANEIAVRYIEGLQLITGEAFDPDLRPRDQRIVDSTNLILDTLL